MKIVEISVSCLSPSGCSHGQNCFLRQTLLFFTGSNVSRRTSADV